MSRKETLPRFLRDSSLKCPHCSSAIPLSVDLFSRKSIVCRDCAKRFAARPAFEVLAKARSDATAAAIVESERADQLASYRSRGRALEKLSVDDVQSRWQTEYRAFVRRARRQEEQHTTLMEDCAAELRLRGLEPDMEPVRDESEALRKTIKRVVEEFPEGTPELRRKIEEFRRRSNDEAN